jgi:predicted tellurium resistance membrane protein TerC
LLIIGLAISIPLVIFGSTLMIKLMERYPIIITLGAALIGWVGGETIASDAVLRDFSEANSWFHLTAAACGAVVVFAWGKFNQSKHHKEAQAD